MVEEGLLVAIIKTVPHRSLVLHVPVSDGNSLCVRIHDVSLTTHRSFRYHMTRQSARCCPGQLIFSWGSIHQSCRPGRSLYLYLAYISTPVNLRTDIVVVYLILFGTLRWPEGILHIRAASISVTVAMAPFASALALTERRTDSIN